MKIAQRLMLTDAEASFAAATLTPAVLLLLGALWGGAWAFLAFLSMTGLLFIFDRLSRHFHLQVVETTQTRRAQQLTMVLGAVHFALLFFAVFALSGGTGLGWAGWFFCFLGFGLWFGQVSNSCAHELIHRSHKPAFWLGEWIFISLLYGHHVSSHRLVHHSHVATSDDPNTAAEGENFYEFLLRAWPGEFQTGYEMENARRDGPRISAMQLHPYTRYLGGAAIFVLIFGQAFGFYGFLSYILLCFYAQIQLLLSDYVQHYGLERRKIGLDSHEPVGPQHSWDAPDLFSGLMMLNSPRHSDHHLHPTRTYTELEISEDGRAPLLPYSLPVMATLALVPTVWHRIMDRRLVAFKTGTKVD